ncbi:LPXTG cell wall anchor domain-containing protein [Glycomyces sp. YM15]|uniref:LPXTG cell wall anchor domain-containing protein n=1 Tax=Glycomyces sp. YM15 TaxID=2800446 RepID=UPI00196281FC|nr:LPXTG cell wall anchor domain-containing protein [Glycomyces sp. YM15]
MHSSYPRRAGRRALAVLGTAALGVGAFALPAAAQTPEPAADVVFDEPVEAGADFATGAIHLAFGGDFEPGEHDVTAQLSVYGDGWRLAGGTTDDGSCELGGTPEQWVNCTAADAEAEIDFAFDYAADAGTPSGEYDYSLLIGVDGVNLEPINGTVEVDGDDGDPTEDRPYLHGSTEYTDAKPGEGVQVAADFLQVEPLPEDTAAVVVTAFGSDYTLNGLTRATAGYDNCTEYEDTVSCVVTDFEDLPETVFGFADPITYEVSGTAPGPVEVCGCSYMVRTVDADELEEHYGGVFWDEGSDNLFGFRVVTEPESEFEDSHSGYIGITTAPHPFDLSVAASNAKGAKGDQAQLTVPVKNLGTADAWGFFDGPGSYGLIGELPKGLELVTIDSDGDDLNCFESGDAFVKDSFPGSDLKNADFVCLFYSLGAGESFDFKFTVKITDAGASGKGSLEVAAIDNDGYPGVADGDKRNDKADITVNGSGSPKLPKTGTSFGLIIGVAALVLVVGVVLFVLSSRRRKATDAE